MLSPSGTQGNNPSPGWDAMAENLNITEWTESWIRSLANWKAFKAGQELCQRGAVADLKRSESTCQGTLREGKLTLRPLIKVAGKNDITVACACPENRATGAICAHAVAVMLSAMQKSGPNPNPAAKSPSPKNPASAPVLRAYEVQFSPNFRDEWRKGTLALRLMPSEQAPGPVDFPLHEWLVGKKVALDKPGPVVVRVMGDDLEGFLTAIEDHPRLRCGSQAFMCGTRASLELESTSYRDGRVELKSAEPAQSCVRWGSSPAVLLPEGVLRFPSGHASEEWHAQVRQLIEMGRISLPVASFIGRLDAWLDQIGSPAPGWVGSLHLIAAEPEFQLHLEGTQDALEAKFLITYPGLPTVPFPAPDREIEGLPVWSEDRQRVLSRNRHAEAGAEKRLLAAGFSANGLPGGYRLRDRERILGFIADVLPDLRGKWVIREGQRFSQQLQGISVIRPQIRQLGGGEGSWAFELTFQSDRGEKISSSELRQILRGSKRSVAAKGRQVVISRDCEDLAEPLIRELGIGRVDEPFFLSGAKARLFQNLREKFDKSFSSSDPRDQEVPISLGGLKADLRDYQKAGVQWLARWIDPLGGLLLADEMGLGKTLQSIALISALREKEKSGGVVLVVAPTSLLGNWQDELRKFAPHLNVLVFHGSTRDKLRERVKEDSIIVTSYGTLVRDLAFHLSREYRLVVADEASLLRNPDAEVSKALAKLGTKARLALSGTPIENRLQDLWGLFRFVAPGYLGQRADFKEHYEADLSAATMERLKIRLSPFVLRRTKEEVAPDLPEKIEIDEWLTMEPPQAKLYGQLVRAGLDEIESLREKQGENAGRMHLLTLLLRLRQVCVDPSLIQPKDLGSVKLERLLEILSEQRENQSKTLVFSQFAKNLRNIEKRLEGEQMRVFCLDGSTRNRAELVREFQNCTEPAVFLISLKAGGYGLNLTAADTVIHLDPWWNPAVEAQATDRAHRIGQTKPVTVYRLLTRETVEERVLRMQARKRAIIQATSDGAGEIPSNWTMQDMESLLRG
jgi:superfamily II DNA or RNA helicase